MRALFLATLLVAGCTASTGEALKGPAEGAQTGGVLRVGITTPGSLDPGSSYEPMGDLVLRTMCDPLIAADPETGELRPGLAESWVVTDDGQRLVVRLRKGLRFSDGSPLTADDVAFSLSRIASDDFASASAAQLNAIDGYAQMHGEVETEKDSERKQLRGVAAVDERSVQITLSTRKGDFLRLLTSRLTSPVPRKLAGASGFADRPICVGPYALAAPVRPGDRSFTLRRVEGYRPSDSTLSNSGRGYADNVQFQVFATPALAAAAQRKGAVDIAAAEPRDRRGVQSGPSPLIEFVGFPTAQQPLFDKPVVRRALALALDRTALAGQVFPQTRTAATGFLPPTTLPVFEPGGCKQLPVRGDAALAKRLLVDQGVSLQGMKVSFSVNSDGRNVVLARAVAARWKQVLGLDAVVRPLGFQAFVNRGASPRGLDGVFRFSWATPYPDPDGSLFPLFSTERVGRDNFSRYSNPAFDRAIVRQARESNEAADRALEYRAAEQLLCEDLPMVPLTFSLSRYLVKPTVRSAAKGYLDRTSGQPLLRELWIP